MHHRLQLALPTAGPRRQAWSSVSYSGMQTKEACNEDDNYHYADDVKNVHCVFRSRYARFQYESAALKIANVRTGRHVPSITEVVYLGDRPDIDQLLRTDLR
jgi:hypothetical protein